MTLSEILGGFGLTILAGLTGHNYLEISKIKEKIPESYRTKSDCKEICVEFRNIASKIERHMEEGFNRIYDKLEHKEDKS